MSGFTENDHPSVGKADKKTAKALAKAEKKRAAAQVREALIAAQAKDGDKSNTGPSATTITPAERSAAAAERQVRLQCYRVMIALLTMFVAAATLFVTLRTWTPWFGPSAKGIIQDESSNVDPEANQSKEPS